MDLSRKCIFIITGASKGIGRAIAIESSRLFKADSVILLLARSLEGLQETRNKILEHRTDLTIELCSINLESATHKDFKDILHRQLKDIDLDTFDLAFIVHNVGTLGDVSKTSKDLTDEETWTQYFRLNNFGVYTFNAEFMKMFERIPKIVVNITTKGAIRPFAMVEYCTSRAAREMYFKVLALEEPNTVVLNYSPGPVDTDMVGTLQREATNKELKEMFTNLRATNSLLPPEKTASKCLSVLQEFKFKSGDHVDFYD